MDAARIKLRLNKTMTSSQVVGRRVASCVGGRSKKHARATRRAHEQKARTPGRRCKNATRNLSESVGRVLAFPAFELIGRVPRGTGWAVFSFRPTVIFQTASPSSNPTHQSELNCKRRRRRRTNTQDDVQEAGRCHP